MTANVILEKRHPVRKDASTYSVYYGQAFEDGGGGEGKVGGGGRIKLDEDSYRGESRPAVGPRQSNTLLYDRLSAKTATELRAQLPAQLEKDYIIERFQAGINQSSDVHVVSVINHVFLFFKLVTVGHRRAGAQHGSLARLRDEPGYAFPRVDAVPNSE